MLTLLAILSINLAGQDPASSPAPTPAPGSAAEAAGLFHQVFPHWAVRCDDPLLVRDLIQFDIALDHDGRIVSGPTPVNPRDDAAWRATAESARIALIAAAPFQAPEGYGGGRYRPTFNAARVCTAR